MADSRPRTVTVDKPTVEKNDSGPEQQPLPNARRDKGANVHHEDTVSTLAPDSTMAFPDTQQQSAGISPAEIRRNSAPNDSTAMHIDVVLKSAELELESPTATTLRRRRSPRSFENGQADSNQHNRQWSVAVNRQLDGNASLLPETMHRKPSLSSVRDNVPAGIKTEPNIASFKMCIDEASPVAILKDKQQGEKSKSCAHIDEDDDFDWEVDKIHEDKDKKDSEGGISEKGMRLQDDICCAPLSGRIHPWIIKLFKNAILLAILLVPKFALKHLHAHHSNTVVLADEGRPYVAVVVGNHVGYYLVQLLVMALFKIIHSLGTVKIKITLETYDALVPHFARTVWFFGLIAFWGFLVHGPNCIEARAKLSITISMDEGVDMQCRKWLFWWVYRCMWGMQAMNMLYIMKRYLMQVISDRFEQDNSRFVELNFQGHVLDSLQKIKMPRSAHPPHRHSGLHATHHRWADKSSHWLRSPNVSRPASVIEERPTTAALVSDEPQKRSLVRLMVQSIRRRLDATKERAVDGTATSPAGSITEMDKENELEPQEFVRMSKKRKSKLIHSLRNKPIENPYKRAKDLWTRICPQHRNHLERVDLEQHLKKDVVERVWKLFDPNGSGTITRAMFKQAIVDMVKLRKSFTSTHKTFENAMAKLDMLFNIIVLLFVIVAFLIAFDVGVQQYAVSVSSVGAAFDVGDKIELDDAFFTIMTIHILTTEMKRGDGMRVLSPNHVLASRHIHNLSRSGDHVENVRMDIPLFSSARTIQKLKQKIQNYVETEASADFQKIDVILNATNNDLTNKASLQILFRVFHRGRWVDSEYGPRRLKAVLFLRATLNELEQEDLRDLIALRQSLGYAGPVNPAFLQEIQQSSGQQQPTFNEYGDPVGHVGDRQAQSELGAIYLAHEPTSVAAHSRSSSNAKSQCNNQTLTVEEGAESSRLSAPYVLVPENIQLSTVSANYRPLPDGSQFPK
ncbi:hypothetical protein EC968_001840 [Mortierella alpina]|nr:hypothetical protein EC968_001840 [Mortierella alpina]